ncbi:MAG: DnaB-like helicase C-terminal domain-containing protein [Acidobacteriota bacterium]
MPPRKPLLDGPCRILLAELAALFPGRTVLARVPLADLGAPAGRVTSRIRVDALVVGSDGVPELALVLDGTPAAIRAIERALDGMPVVNVASAALAADPADALHVPLARIASERGDDRLEHPDVFLGRGEEHPRTGLAELDRKLGALWPGELVLVGGTTGTGKSSFVRQLAIANAFRRALPTLYVSLESTARQVGAALLCAAARVSPEKLGAGGLGALDAARVRATSETMADAPIRVVCRSDASLAFLEGQVKHHARTGAKLVLLDYLELLGGDDREATLVALKRMARRNDVPIVVVCNALTLSRIHRADGRPDLLDVGDLGLHADKVVLLHREEVYDLRSDNAYVTEAIIAKNRGGPSGMVTVAFYEQFQRFEDLEVSYDNAPRS